MSDENTHIDEILRSKIGSEHSFKVPSGYFESLEPTIMGRLIAETSNKQRDPSVIPHNYFDTIEETVMDRIRNEKINTTPIRTLNTLKKRKRLIGIISIAASILLLFSIFPLNSNTNNNYDFSNLSVDEIILWMEQHEEEFSNTEIASVYEKTAIDKDIESYNIPEDEIINYLNETPIENLFYEN